jgi:hypothetical protein
MQMILKLLLLLTSLGTLGVFIAFLFVPRLNRWGANQEEIDATYPGDELVPAPARFINRAITIQASPAQIYPWLVQLGADKGGLYSYTRLEALIRCSMVNADRIHPEWQNLQVGDEVKMCRNEPAPPPYIVAQIHPNQAIVLGHQDNGAWVDLWQFVLVPQADGATRLILRTRTMMTGGFWDAIQPGVFVMEYGTLHGIKARAEKAA